MPEKEADKITIYWGVEKISPVRFEPFEFGGFHYTTSVRKGETEEEAFERGYAFLENMAKKKYAQKMQGFRDRMLEARQDFSQHKGGFGDIK